MGFFEYTINRVIPARDGRPCTTSPTSGCTTLLGLLLSLVSGEMHANHSTRALDPYSLVACTTFSEPDNLHPVSVSKQKLFCKDFPLFSFFDESFQGVPRHPWKVINIVPGVCFHGTADGSFRGASQKKYSYPKKSHREPLVLFEARFSFLCVGYSRFTYTLRSIGFGVEVLIHIHLKGSRTARSVPDKSVYVSSPPTAENAFQFRFTHHHFIEKLVFFCFYGFDEIKR